MGGFVEGQRGVGGGLEGVGRCVGGVRGDGMSGAGEGWVEGWGLYAVGGGVGRGGE